MLELVRRRVLEHLPPGEDAPSALERIVSLDAARGVLDGYCFLFFDRQGAPRLVAKAARTAAGRAVFRTEHETLGLLEQRGLNAQGDAVPRPLGLWEEGESLVTLQTALRGRLLKNEPGAAFFSRRKLPATLERLVAWHERFHDCVGVVRAEMSDEVYEREVTFPTERFLRRFRNPEQDRAFLRQRLLEERRLAGLHLPLMARHGDFCTANMVLQPHGLGVFDWEFPIEPRLPLFDLFFFLSSTRFPFGSLRGESRHFDSFVAVFWGDSYFSDQARSLLRETSRRYEIPTQALGDLFLVALIHVANMKYEAMLEARGLIEPVENTAADDDGLKRRRWDDLPKAEKDVPFACIRQGRLENLSQVVAHGLPPF